MAPAPGTCSPAPSVQVGGMLSDGEPIPGFLPCDTAAPAPPSPTPTPASPGAPPVEAACDDTCDAAPIGPVVAAAVLGVLVLVLTVALALTCLQGKKKAGPSAPAEVAVSKTSKEEGL